MGDHDTRADAIRLAVEAAKKDVLEQVATYLESVTEVRDLDVTRDDIRSYTAGIVQVLDQTITTRLEGDDVVIRADLTAQVEPDEVARAIVALRENESAKSELSALRAETDQLQQQLDAANRALADASSPEQVQTANQQRQDTLNELQANALVSQAWTSMVYATPGYYSYPWIGVAGVNGLLLQAQRLYPRHRHLPLAQQFVTTQAGKLPPAPAGIRRLHHAVALCWCRRPALCGPLSRRPCSRLRASPQKWATSSSCRRRDPSRRSLIGLRRSRNNSNFILPISGDQALRTFRPPRPSRRLALP